MDKKNSCYLSQIVSYEPSKGNGTKCMEYILKALKKKGIKKLYLIASPFSYQPFGDEHERRLINWYKRFGFKLLKDNEMVLDLTNQ